MACFTPKNNAYCLPKVDAFLDTEKFVLGSESNPRGGGGGLLYGTDGDARRKF